MATKSGKSGPDPRPRDQLFWSHVEFGPGCWRWKGAHTHSGYGVFGTPAERAHRVAWKLVNGEIPDGQYACHVCDVRDCVRPEHLFLGTSKENTHDAMRKGRLGKLSEEQVAEIRTRIESGAVLGREYGVSRSLINFIRAGRRRV